jgi:hypothetical protein
MWPGEVAVAEDVYGVDGFDDSVTMTLVVFDVNMTVSPWTLV